MMNGWRLEAHTISIGNFFDWSFTKPPQMQHDWSFAKPPQMKRTRICTALGAVHMRMEQICGQDFGFLVLNDDALVLFRMHIHICTEKTPGQYPASEWQHESCSSDK
jgi:hypothetical protein